jgi:hypothetical protein
LNESATTTNRNSFGDGQFGFRHRRTGSDADIPLEKGRTIPAAG